MQALRLLLHVRDVRRAGDGAHRRNAPAAADQRVRRNETGRRTRAAARRARHRAFGAIALRYFNAAGADPDGLIGEDHRPGRAPDSAGDCGGAGRQAADDLWQDYDTPDGTCVRDYVHVCDLADAHLASLARLEAGGPSGFYNLGSGTGMSVKQVVDSVGAGVRPARPAFDWAPARRRSGAARGVERRGPPRPGLGAEAG